MHGRTTEPIRTRGRIQDAAGRKCARAHQASMGPKCSATCSKFNIEALSEKENIDFDKALGQGCTLKLNAYEDKKRIYHGDHDRGAVDRKDRRFLSLPDHVAAVVLAARPQGRLPDLSRQGRQGHHQGRVRPRRDSTTSNSGPMATTRKSPTACSIAKPIWHSSAGSWSCTESIISSSIPTANTSDGAGRLALLAQGRSRICPKVPFIPLSESELRPEQHLYSWISERRFRTGKVQFNDYDYLKPKKNLLAPSEASEKYTHAKLEVYDFPGKYDEEDKGKKLSRFRLEAEQASRSSAHHRGRRPFATSRRPRHGREAPNAGGEQGISGRSRRSSFLVAPLSLRQAGRRHREGRTVARRIRSITDITSFSRATGRSVCCR